MSAPENDVKPLTKKELYLLIVAQCVALTGYKNPTRKQIHSCIFKQTGVKFSHHYIADMKRSNSPMKRKNAVVFADFLNIDIERIADDAHSRRSKRELLAPKPELLNNPPNDKPVVLSGHTPLKKLDQPTLAMQFFNAIHTIHQESYYA